VVTSDFGRNVENPRQGYTYLGLALSTHRLDEATNDSPLTGEEQELNVMLEGNLLVQMRRMGTLTSYPFEAYCEVPNASATTQSAKRYAVIVNTGTPYQKTYIFRAEDAPVEDSWALWVLDIMAADYIPHYMAFIPSSYLSPSPALEQVVFSQQLLNLLRITSGFRDSTVLQGSRYLGLIAEDFASPTSVVDEGQFINDAGKKTYKAAHHIDHMLLSVNQAESMDVPPGVYALISMTFRTDEDKQTDRSVCYFTVLHWVKFAEKWSPVHVPQQGNQLNERFPAICALTEPENGPKVSLEEAILLLTARAE